MVETGDNKDNQNQVKEDEVNSNQRCETRNL